MENINADTVIQWIIASLILSLLCTAVWGVIEEFFLKKERGGK